MFRNKIFTIILNVNFIKTVSLRKIARNVTNVETTSSMNLHLSVDHPDAEIVAIDMLKNGQVIAIPTDTVYGLACSAEDVVAINKVYLIKERNENKPVSICVGKVSDVPGWVQVNHLPRGLLSTLLPGPVTIVLKCANKLDKSLSFNGKVGIRIPDHLFIQKIANELNCPLVLTSANKSSEPSSVIASEFKPLWHKVPGVFDGGVIGEGNFNRSASTVVDLSEPEYYKIIRTGIAVTRTRDILKKYGIKFSL